MRQLLMAFDSLKNVNFIKQNYPQLKLDYKDLIRKFSHQINSFKYIFNQLKHMQSKALVSPLVHPFN